MLSLASELQFAVTPLDIWSTYLSHSTLMRLKARGDNFQYQSAAYHIANFPRSHARTVFPEECVTVNTEKVQTWVIASMIELAKVFDPIMTRTDTMAAGCTKALKMPSERVVRVVSTMICPVEISWVKLPKGYEALYINFNFVLVDEDGEMHAPKDENRREIALSNTDDIRAQVLADVRSLSQNGCPLGPGWWNQLGMPEKAAEVQLMLSNPYQRKQARQRGNPQSAKYDIDCIVDERKSTGRAGMWYLVRWSGYQPEWEAWRINGRAGVDPIETWEPRSVVQHSEALCAWKNRSAQAVDATHQEEVE